MLDLRRRRFLTLLGGAAVAWPLAARAQQPAMPVIGFVSNASFDERQRHVAAFRDGLNDGGYVEGRNVALEFRWAEHYLDPLAPMIADLISNRRVAMIVASGSPAVERIAVFLDGTWNTVNDNTKVWRLKALCALECQNDGLQQCLYYNPGVGTKYGEKIRGGILTNRARDNGDIRRGERAFTSAVAGWRDQLSTF